MDRIVEPELLDALPWNHPEALRARADLRRVNLLMNNSKALAEYLRMYLPQFTSPSPHLRIVEIGAGDGTVLLAVARRLRRLGVTGDVIMMDRHPVFSDDTKAAFAALGWKVDLAVADVLEDLDSTFASADVVMANMFLHHFQDAQLTRIFAQLQKKTNLVVACEPRRSRPVMMAGKLLWLLGCSALTRHDGALSIRAGFREKEMSSLWPDREGWELMEGSANLFNHGFVARRRAMQ
ncbi:MAG: class SAM-dependent methyltransferase [Verrucomicrobiaceae bacterium]|nr:class SAM-dependent methyltransferase [Verrucomicrobiaceae bacterium]